MRKMVFILCLLAHQILGAQNGTPQIAGAKGMAMANASVAVKDVGSIFSNQAGMAFVLNPEAIVYGERRFELSDLNQVAAAVVFPSELGAFGLQMSYFGFDLYNEQKIGIAYARRLMDKLSLGVQFDWLNTQIANYGNKGVITFEIGLMSPITSNLTIGVHLYSPMRVELIEGEELPPVFKVGLAYEASKKVLLTAEVEKESDLNPNVKAGLEYLIHPSLAIRLGVASNPSLFSFGLGYRINNQFFIDVASSYHQDLGFSPSISVRYAFAKS